MLFRSLRFLQTHQVTLRDLRARPTIPVPYWVVMLSGAALGVTALGVVSWRSVKNGATPAIQAAELARVEKPATAPVKILAPAKIWVVESVGGMETYSNGLRVETKFATTNRSRAFYAYDRQKNLEVSLEIRNRPVGIVFHTTESNLAEFGPEQNRTLRHYGQSLISYIRM